MRPGLNNRRPRHNRGNVRRGGSNQGSRALDSNGPDIKIRGTASQIFEKYLALARDANSAGDRIKAENYLQHAEHYYRILNPNGSGQKPAQQQQQQASASGQESDGAAAGAEPETAAGKEEAQA